MSWDNIALFVVGFVFEFWPYVLATAITLATFTMETGGRERRELMCVASILSWTYALSGSLEKCVKVASAALAVSIFLLLNNIDKNLVTVVNRLNDLAGRNSQGE